FKISGTAASQVGLPDRTDDRASPSADHAALKRGDVTLERYTGLPPDVAWQSLITSSSDNNEAPVANRPRRVETATDHSRTMPESFSGYPISKSPTAGHADLLIAARKFSSGRSRPSSHSICAFSLSTV